MVRLSQNLDVSNIKSYTNSSSKINKPVVYDSKKNKLVAESPLRRLTLRLKAAVTGKSFDKVIRESVTKALTNYTDKKLGLDRSKVWNKASDKITNITELKSAIRTLNQGKKQSIFAREVRQNPDSRSYFKAENEDPQPLADHYADLSSYQDEEPINYGAEFEGTTFKDKEDSDPLATNDNSPIKETEVSASELHDDDDESDWSEFDDFDDDDYSSVEEPATPADRIEEDK